MKSCPSKSGPPVSRLRTLVWPAVAFAAALAQGAEVLSPEEEAELRARGASPVLKCSPLTLSANVEQGATATLGLTIRNAGGQVLRWSVSFVPTWAKAVPEGGELAHGEAAEVVVVVDGSTLSPGATRGDIVVNAPGAEGSPAKVALAVEVKPRGAPASRGAGQVVPVTPAPAPAPAVPSRRFRVSAGWGVCGHPPMFIEIEGREEGRGVTLGVFGIGFQFGSYEMIVIGPASMGFVGEEDSRHEELAGGWTESSVGQEGPIILFRKYWGRPDRPRGLVQFGTSSYWLDLKTEMAGGTVTTDYLTFGLGLRKAFRHGYFEFWGDLLSGGGDEIVEQHSFDTSIWRFNEEAFRFCVMAGLTF